jgi:hypothetical protein
MSSSRITKLPYQTYLAVIRNSVGSTMFRNIPILLDGKAIDATQDGTLSCVFYVSALLKMFGLVGSFHATVCSTEKDIVTSGFIIIDQEAMQPGDVIIWEAIDFGTGGMHQHIGFYMGNDRAISNSETARSPVEHHVTFGDKNRGIEMVYRLERRN